MTGAKKELRSVCNRIGGALLLFLALFSVFYGGATALEQLLTKQFPHSVTLHIITDLISSICYAFSFLFPVVFFYIISKKANSQPMRLSLGLSKENAVLSTLVIVFLGTAVCHTCSYVNSILFPIPQSAYSMLETSVGGGYELVLMFISTAIIPAFVEELLFRGMVLSNLRPYSETGAILASALLFGLMHQTPFQFFYTTGVGIVLGLVYVKTGTIWSSILLHFFNNFVSVLQTYLSDKPNERVGESVYNIITIFIILIGLLCGMLLAVKVLIKRKEKVKKLGVYGQFDDAVQRKEDPASAVCFFKAFFSPTIIVFLLLCVGSICSTAIMLWRM